MRTAFCLAVILCIATVAHAAVIGKATVTADQAPVMSGKEVISTAKKGDTFDAEFEFNLKASRRAMDFLSKEALDHARQILGGEFTIVAGAQKDWAVQEGRGWVSGKLNKEAFTAAVKSVTPDRLKQSQETTGEPASVVFLGVVGSAAAFVQASGQFDDQAFIVALSNLDKAKIQKCATLTGARKGVVLGNLLAVSAKYVKDGKFDAAAFNAKFGALREGDFSGSEAEKMHAVMEAMRPATSPPGQVQPEKGATPASTPSPHATARPDAAPAAVIGKATVTADQAPVMSGKQVIATAKKGDTFDVTEVKGDWYGIAPSQGWIHKSHVRYDPMPPASPAAPPVLPPADDKIIRAGAKVRVSSNSAPVKLAEKTLTTLNEGTVLVAQDVRGPLVAITMEQNGQKVYGWVEARHLSPVSVSEPRRTDSVALPKIRTAFQSRVGNMGTLLRIVNKSGKEMPLVLATTLSGEPIMTACADMSKRAVYLMQGPAPAPPAVELKSIKCDVELKVDGKTFSGNAKGEVTIIAPSLPDNVRADCRTVAAQALGVGNCLDVTGGFDGFYLIIFDDSGAVVQTHCLVCSNPGSRLQSDSYRIVPATVTVKGVAAGQSLPSEVIYVKRL